jgi:hypothetical protein
MSDPKRHHFVPQMLLAHLTDDRGRVFVFDRQQPGAGVREPVPSEVLLQRHLYSTEDASGAKDPAFEKELSKLESRANPLCSAAWRRRDSIVRRT